MLIRTAILSAVLIGMASPTTAQRRAQRDLPESSVHMEHPTPGNSGSVVRGGRSRGNGGTPVVRGRGHGQVTAGHGHNHNHGNQGPRGNRGNRSYRGNRGRGGVVLGGGRRGTVVHYRYVTKKVWVPERHVRVLIPARYEMRWDPYCRQYVRVCVREAYYETRCEPGYWDYR